MKWISRLASADENGLSKKLVYDYVVESVPDDGTEPVICCVARNEKSAQAIAAALNLVIFGQGIQRITTIILCAEAEARGDLRPENNRF